MYNGFHSVVGVCNDCWYFRSHNMKTAFISPSDRMAFNFWNESITQRDIRGSVYRTQFKLLLNKNTFNRRLCDYDLLKFMHHLSSCMAENYILFWLQSKLQCKTSFSLKRNSFFLCFSFIIFIQFNIGERYEQFWKIKMGPKVNSLHDPVPSNIWKRNLNKMIIGFLFVNGFFEWKTKKSVSCQCLFDLHTNFWHDG